MTPAALALYAVARRDLRALERKTRPALRFPLAVAYAAAVVLLTAVALGGCAVSAAGTSTGPELPSAGTVEGRQPDEALSLILASYGAPGEAHPYVLWVDGTDDCHGVAWFDNGRCLRGVFYPAYPNVITVATWPGAHVSQVSLAHETLHWLHWRQGVNDFDHGGDFYARVDAANDMLWRGK